MREAVLGRLTPPSLRLFEQLTSDPQVIAALDLATDGSRYDKILDETVAIAAPPPPPGPAVTLVFPPAVHES